MQPHRLIDCHLETFFCLDICKPWKRFLPDMNVVSWNRRKEKWTVEVRLQSSLAHKLISCLNAPDGDVL